MVFSLRKLNGTVCHSIAVESYYYSKIQIDVMSILISANQ